MTSAVSDALPETLEPDLARLRAYWEDLIRGENPMPFSDDVDLSHLPDLAPRLVLLQAFENPERFRFESAGTEITQAFGRDLNGAFTDEIGDAAPLESLTRQCGATVARRAPTYARAPAHARLLLPTWGDGHVLLLLGAVAPAQG